MIAIIWKVCNSSLTRPTLIILTCSCIVLQWCKDGLDITASLLISTKYSNKRLMSGLSKLMSPFLRYYTWGMPYACAHTTVCNKIKIVSIKRDLQQPHQRSISHDDTIHEEIHITPQTIADTSNSRFCKLDRSRLTKYSRENLCKSGLRKFMSAFLRYCSSGTPYASTYTTVSIKKIKQRIPTSSDSSLSLPITQPMEKYKSYHENPRSHIPHAHTTHTKLGTS